VPLEDETDQQAGSDPSYCTPYPNTAEFLGRIFHLFKRHGVYQRQSRHENHHVSKDIGIKSGEIIGLEHSIHQDCPDQMQYSEDFFSIEIFVSNKTYDKRSYDSTKRLRGESRR